MLKEALENEVTEVSGRGVGMDAVNITVRSKIDEGTTFVIELPFIN